MHDIFYFTDIHGMYDLYRAIMDYCNEQDPEAMIIFGGDACDRGPDGYKIMKELLNNPKVCYLMGNHEEMFTQAAREILEHFDIQTNDTQKIKECLYNTFSFGTCYLAIQTVLYNGGLSTLTDWILDGKPIDIIEHLEKLPRTFSYEKYDFCHAGGIYRTFKEIADAEYDGTEPNLHSKTAVLWNRTGLNYGWEPGRICIFGHTSVPYVMKAIGKPWNQSLDPTPIRYVGTNREDFTGEKICMDTGAAFLGQAYVLNILTLQAQGFEDTDLPNKEIRKHDVKKIDCIQM